MVDNTNTIAAWQKWCFSARILPFHHKESCLSEDKAHHFTEIMLNTVSNIYIVPHHLNSSGITMTALVLLCSRPTFWDLHVFVVKQAGLWTVKLIRSGILLVCFLLFIVAILLPGLSSVGISHRGLCIPAGLFPFGWWVELSYSWPVQARGCIELLLAPRGH